RDHSAGARPQAAPLPAPDRLLRPRVRRGEEDRLARRPARRVDASAAPLRQVATPEERLRRTATAPDGGLRGLPRPLHAAAQVGLLSATATAVLRPTYRSRRPLLANRHELPVLLNRRGLLGSAVEIGVRAGEF